MPGNNIPEEPEWAPERPSNESSALTQKRIEELRAEAKKLLAWEYTVFPIADVAYRELERSLNILGAEGWELVGCFTVGSRILSVLRRGKSYEEDLS